MSVRRPLSTRVSPFSLLSFSGWPFSGGNFMAERQIQTDPGARRALGRLIGIGIVVAAVIMVVVALVQWEIRPQTDDATVRANFVGIAPQVNGHIVELHVRDNQQVNEGDLLFLIDPRPYKIAVDRARATLA